MGQLDNFSTQLLKIVKKRRSSVTEDHKHPVSYGSPCHYWEKRECILKSLADLLNEEPSNLVKEYMDVEHEDALT